MENNSIQKYFDRALRVLEKYNLVPKEDDGSQLGDLLQSVSHVNEARVLAIARILKHISAFNDLVRENVEQIKIGDRYAKITDLFNSVRDDSKALVSQLEDGKIGLGEEVQNLWMKFTRGTPHERFEKISDIYNEVCEDTKDQLLREDTIMDGYIDFRFAVKEAEVLSHELLAIQEENLNAAKDVYQNSVNDLEANKKDEPAVTSKLQLARDEAQQRLSDEDKSYQLIKDVSENLSISYNVGETLISKLKQTHDVKEQIFRRAVTFFSTNEHVFTVLDAVYTSQHGLHEATQTTEALKEGVNKGLEDVSELGRSLERAALKAGYGSTINPQSVQKLVDAIVSYQVESKDLIKELRDQSTKDAEEIGHIVEKGKNEFKQALDRFHS